MTWDTDHFVAIILFRKIIDSLQQKYGNFGLKLYFFLNEMGFRSYAGKNINNVIKYWFGLFLNIIDFSLHVHTVKLDLWI